MNEKTVCGNLASQITCGGGKRSGNLINTDLRSDTLGVKFLDRHVDLLMLHASKGGCGVPSSRSLKEQNLNSIFMHLTTFLHAGKYLMYKP